MSDSHRFILEGFKAINGNVGNGIDSSEPAAKLVGDLVKFSNTK